jgi:hypothetical protein
LPYEQTPRSILIAAPCLAGTIGLSYIFGSPIRTISPSFNAAKDLAPMHAWGVLFLAGAIFTIVSLLTKNAYALAAAFFVGGVIYVWWGSCFGLQGLTDARASLVAWALYAWIALNHFIVAGRCWRNRAPRRTANA